MLLCVCIGSYRHIEVVRFLPTENICLISTLINHIELISKMILCTNLLTVNFPIMENYHIFILLLFESFYCYPFLLILILSIFLKIAFFMCVLQFYSRSVARECLQDCGIPFCLWVLGYTSTAGTSEQVSLLVASYRASFE